MRSGATATNLLHQGAHNVVGFLSDGSAMISSQAVCTPLLQTESAVAVPHLSVCLERHSARPCKVVPHS